MRTLLKIILAILFLVCSPALMVLAGPREMIEQACRNYVIDQLHWNPDDVAIIFHSYIRPELEWTGVRLHVSHPRNADLCGVVTLKVAAVKDGDTLRSFPVPVEIALYDDVVVTTRRLRHGDEVSSGDVAIRRQQVDLRADAPFTDVAKVVGRRATLALPVGRILSGSAIEELPLIKRGDRVTLRFQRKNLLLTAQGEAIEDGWAGRQVRIRNLSSKKLITGIAAESGVIDVTLAASGE